MAARSTVEKRASPENHKSKRWPSPENSPIFFKFWQELYYIMLKQISVTICHNLWPSHYSKVSRKWFHQFGQPPSLFLLYWTKSSDCSSRQHYCTIWTLNGAFWIFKKKWSAIFFPDLSGKSNNRKFRNVVMRNGNTETRKIMRCLSNFLTWSYECHPRSP